MELTKKEWQCETSATFISVSSDPDTARVAPAGFVCLFVRLCVSVYELIDEARLLLESRAALHIPTLKFSDATVYVSVNKRRVRG